MKFEKFKPENYKNVDIKFTLNNIKKFSDKPEEEHLSENFISFIYVLVGYG